MFHREEAGIELEEMLFAGVVCAFWTRAKQLKWRRFGAFALDYRGLLGFA